MFWLCLRFAQLALDVVRTGLDLPPRTPCAVVDGPPQRRQVVLADAAARKAGVHAGQPLAAAHLLCPRLAVAPRDAAAERQALDSLAAWAYRYSADVSLAAPDALYVEVGASLALFGGWPALERRLRAELAGFGFACSLAAAPTAAAAHVLAGLDDGLALPALAQLAPALGAVPLVHGGLAAKAVATLHGMGLRTLGELFRLPRAELARRIGTDALDQLDRLRGLAAEALPRWQPPARFERGVEFAFGVESHTALAFPLQRLIGELALFLRARDGGVQRFTLVLGHERGASTRVEVGLLAPQREAAALFELARTRLDRIALPAPVHALAVRADDLPPLCPLHQDLFETNRREQLDWPMLAERLRARLGNDALKGLDCVADHRPARAWRFVSLDAPADPPRKNGRGSGGSRDALIGGPRAEGRGLKSIAAAAAPTARPFWLLPRPLALREAPLRVLAGPERIESGWWDERDQRRDYYIVQLRSGQRAWAFVEAGTTDGWTVHGWFA
ncbi:MAG: DNA polymerase Y family protein [Rhodanobacteraceae bacterium]|jgi:protein ImuB|nr:DNA polymerase Y family protein [Rhodanobacteraceae bacterium]